MPRVAAVHAAPEFLDVPATIEKACAYIREAGERDIDLVVFPEVFVPGFPAWINCYAPIEQLPLQARYVNASVAADGPEIRRVCRAAAAAGTVVVLGVNERAAGTLYNSQVVISDTGDVLGVHRKLQPTYAERTVWGQGDASTLKVWDTSVGRVGALVCWEHTMNLARQALIAQDMQIHAASWPGLETLAGFEVFNDQVEALMKAHALSGQCFVVAAMSPFTQQMLDVMEDAIGPQSIMAKPAGGWSAIVEPMTGVVGGPERGLEEKLVVADIDLGAIDIAKLFVDSNGHYSRGELLTLVVDDEPKAAARFRSAGATPPVAAPVATAPPATSRNGATATEPAMPAHAPAPAP